MQLSNTLRTILFGAVASVAFTPSAFAQDEDTGGMEDTAVSEPEAVEEEAPAKKKSKGEKRKRAALFFELEPGLSGRNGLKNPNPAIAFGIDYNGRADKLIRHHLRLGYKQMSIGAGIPTLKGLTFSPAILGAGIPIIESDGFRLEIEVQFNIFKIDFLKVSRGGSDLIQVDFSSGIGAQVQAVISDKFFVAVTPVTLDFQFGVARIGDGIFNTIGSDDGLGINFPVGVFFGFEY